MARSSSARSSSTSNRPWSSARAARSSCSRAHAHLEFYTGLENYRANWRRMGFGPEDFVRGGSERLCDAMVVHGDADGHRPTGPRALRGRRRPRVSAGARSRRRRRPRSRTGVSSRGTRTLATLTSVVGPEDDDVVVTVRWPPPRTRRTTIVPPRARGIPACRSAASPP